MSTVKSGKMLIFASVKSMIYEKIPPPKYKDLGIAKYPVNVKKAQIMPITHKIFLYWLLYLALIGFSAAVLILMGLPQLAFEHDKSYLSVALVAMYFLAEAMSGKQAVWISRQHRNLLETAAWMEGKKIQSLTMVTDGSVIIGAKGSGWTVIPGPFADLIRSLATQKANGPTRKMDQQELLDAFAEHLDRRISIGDFIASRIVWVGILATIIGVIMAFWPFQAAGMSIDAMRSNLGEFFSGVAVAFIPTAVSFVFKIILDVNGKILQDGASEMIEMATAVSSGYIVPSLENGSVRL